MKTFSVDARTLPSAWEQAILLVWQQGQLVPTQYDREGDPPSRDATVLIRVTDPFDEPRYHRCLPMGLDSLEQYVCEVLYGVHDDRIIESGSYTYHDRLTNYGGVNQIKRCVEQLRECPYTRRAQAITWHPALDPWNAEPPCLQSLLFRVLNGRLGLVVRFRSNDLFKAALSNMVALTELQAMVAADLGVSVGDYVHFADSMHIYGKDERAVRGLLKQIEDRSFEERTWTSQECAGEFLCGCWELLTDAEIPEASKKEVKKREVRWAKLVRDE